MFEDEVWKELSSIKERLAGLEHIRETGRAAEIRERLSEFFTRNDKIGAIKLVRTMTGMQLAEAKEFVERFPQYRMTDSWTRAAMDLIERYEPKG